MVGLAVGVKVGAREGDALGAAVGEFVVIAAICLVCPDLLITTEPEITFARALYVYVPAVVGASIKVMVPMEVSAATGTFTDCSPYVAWPRFVVSRKILRLTMVAAVTGLTLTFTVTITLSVGNCVVTVTDKPMSTQLVEVIVSVSMA